MRSLVVPDDPPALAAAIEQLLERRASIERGRLHRHAVDNFGMEQASARLGQLYAEPLPDRPRSVQWNRP